MGRRARKKNKEIIGMDTDSIWYKRNARWGKQMRKKSVKSVMKKVEEFNRSHKKIKIKFPSIRKKKTLVWNPIVDDFKGSLFRKAKANSQLGELHLPKVKKPNRIPHIISSGTYRIADEWSDLHVGDQVHNPIEDIRNSAFGERELCDHEQCRIFAGFATGHCSICNSMLTRLFPKDYPDEWKFCCTCKRIAEILTGSEGIIMFWTKEKIEKVRKKITLAGK